MFSKSLCLVLLVLFKLTHGQDVLSNTLEFLNISSDPNKINFYLHPNPREADEGKLVIIGEKRFPCSLIITTSRFGSNPKPGGNASDVDELIYLSQPSIRNSRFNKSNPIILLTHGFTQGHTSEFPAILRDVYLRAGYPSHTNILSIDWSRLSGKFENPTLTTYLATLPSYIMATRNVPIVGKRLQEFLTFLVQSGFSTPKRIHLIGQSLGAHVAGMAGFFYRNVTGDLLGRITGNDPAGPLYQDRPLDQRLDATDAYFTDIVHTNQGMFGYLGPMGHVDFFINGGGPVQLECLANVTNLFCSHDLAPQYFAKTVVNPKVKACQSPLSSQCPSKRQVTFGEHCPKTARGFYFLEMSL